MYDKYCHVFKKFFAERLSKCLRHHPRVKSVFDIGSGYGFWLDYCRELGLQVKGIDIAEETVRYAQKILNLDVENRSLSEFSFDKRYDIYTLCDVLEHIANPNHELQIIRNAMEKNSLLCIQVPDVLGFRIPYGHNLGLPHHVWQFNLKTLKKLLDKNGFTVLESYYGILGIIGYYSRNEVNMKNRLKWLIARGFRLGNRLTAICRVKS